MDLLSAVIVLALLATILVMMIGLFAMGQGGVLDKMVGVRMMWARVAIQAVAILLLILAVYLR
jgi:phosphopantothenate synthetase